MLFSAFERAAENGSFSYFGMCVREDKTELIVELGERARESYYLGIFIYFQGVPDFSDNRISFI